MTALVLTPFSTRQNAVEVARQDYRLAKKHYQDVCERRDATCPACVLQFQSASERRQAAFEAYMAAMSAQ
ncbi:hypothetical protein [Limnoglobus roseus]|uniref:Uncharacterized protein n=1 Tax=Limnoglobus roseus TaxID=2598579 RepID=A0A5C1ALA4_9BACT|nr:hypothetical protein [Limnoglobus roseus]QEL18746.1 hypothetical protein PX52LOC_05783 [Limnoglobus roseus]